MTTSGRAHLALSDKEFEYLMGLDGWLSTADPIEHRQTDTEELLNDFTRTGRGYYWMSDGR